MTDAFVRALPPPAARVRAAWQKPEGCFRATFEDRVLKSGERRRTCHGQTRVVPETCSPRGPPPPLPRLSTDKTADIIFLRAWVPVHPRKFYIPVTNLLQADKSSWQGMRRVGELRRERALKPPRKADSEYKVGGGGLRGARGYPASLLIAHGHHHARARRSAH